MYACSIEKTENKLGVFCYVKQQQQKSKAHSPFQNTVYIKLKHRVFSAHANFQQRWHLWRRTLRPAVKSQTVVPYPKEVLPQMYGSQLTKQPGTQDVLPWLLRQTA